jgi:hypothetical protein
MIEPPVFFKRQVKAVVPVVRRLRVRLVRKDIKRNGAVVSYYPYTLPGFFDFILEPRMGRAVVVPVVHKRFYAHCDRPRGSFELVSDISGVTPPSHPYSLFKECVRTGEFPDRDRAVEIKPFDVYKTMRVDRSVGPPV